MSIPRKFKLKAIKSQDRFNSSVKWIVNFSSAAAILPEEIEVEEIRSVQKHTGSHRIETSTSGMSSRCVEPGCDWTWEYD